MDSSSSTLPQATDPVCGMRVEPRNARGGSFQHQGNTYYFCNPRCREKFSADPQSYLMPRPLTAVKPALAAPTGARGQYFCPMHPEVVSAGPGDCPLCGMALESQLGEGDSGAELRDLQLRFWVSAALSTPTFVLAMSDLFPTGGLLSARSAVWLQLVLSTPVVFWGGKPLLQRGLASVANRHLNMFTLIALGTLAAFAFSVLATLFPTLVPHSTSHGAGAAVYYEAAAVIITLALLGQVLELRARGATSGAIRALLGLTPKTARRIAEDGSEVDVPLQSVAVGDKLRVRPSEKVPVDGVVVEGGSAVDESSISGEAMPVSKRVGSHVIAGTLNLDGSFILLAERVGSATLLSQIVALVSEAQRSRAPIARLADTVSAWFAPAVVVVAALTAVAWGIFGPEPRVLYALVNAVAVLIIACPCALGLATPMSIMVGTGRGAQMGLLIKNAEALEILSKVDTLVVDKTGTLTEGKPTLRSVVPNLGFTEEQVLSWAASVEAGSEHPLAHAIVSAAAARAIAAPRAAAFRARVGKGVVADVDGAEVALGSAGLLAERGVSIAPLEDQARELRALGQTVMFLSRGSELAGVVAVEDAIKQTTQVALQGLRQAGLRIVMLTGDNEVTARNVAAKLGISDVRAGVLPHEKHQAVAELRALGHVVAMAGDGTNDAPALAAAHVGIAMGSGTDVALQAADVALLKGDLRAIEQAIKLSRAVMTNIRQNLFFAFAYNAVGVPIAAGIAYPSFGILLSPMIASLAMALSSVSVIGNALRLRRTQL